MKAKTTKSAMSASSTKAAPMKMDPKMKPSMSGSCCESGDKSNSCCNTSKGKEAMAWVLTAVFGASNNKVTVSPKQAVVLLFSALITGVLGSVFTVTLIVFDALTALHPLASDIDTM